MKDIKRYGGVSKHPHKYEVVLISEEYSDGETVSSMIPIIRNGKEAELGEMEIQNTSALEGRFTNMLNRPSADDLLKDIKNAKKS